MNGIILVLSPLVLATAFFGWSSARGQDAGTDVQATASANNTFAFDLYARLASHKGNLFFSPYSIDTALAMTYAGARGDTARQMAAVLHYALPQNKLNDAFAGLIQQLNTSGQAGDEKLFQLVVANSLWGQEGYPFHKPFQDIVGKSYRAGLNEVDFRQAEGARRQINAWVEKQTQDKIRDLIGENAIKENTRLILVNAIYFKSHWVEAFEESMTRNEAFRLPDGKSINVPTMHQDEELRYAEDERVQVLELPYRGQRLSMIIVLPKKVDGLAALEGGLTADTLGKWVTSLRPRQVQLALPKFKMSSDFEMSDVLGAMGMKDAFASDRADFSGIATVERLFLSAVIHRAYIDVNEAGTEAAAATAVLALGGAAPTRERAVVFKADHPFVFAIRHQRTGAILFLGRIVQP